ncbi:hypothetical protein CRV00_02740 [Malaciobacter molluscorum]|uniref:hypothetical protein n=1 Tax=Malaciobacter molluscorum TaxID=1032072 RepID=UPI00100B70D5|nr:hypothetical protein [Malaciobacter molluscorum]RXJ96118.1 hypothetical protein CRV00_02740 [Malaciobacter molluscorum]
MKKEKKLSQKLRNWHRDLGYFVIGITIIYSLTGIMLTLRDLHIFEKEYVTIEKIDATKKIENEIKNKFKEKIETLKVIENNDKYIKYQASKKEGKKVLTYFKDTNEAKLITVDYPPYIKPFIQAHKSKSKDKWSYLALAYSTILLFLAISAIFMVKGKYGFKKRGIYLTLGGVLLVVVFLYI